MKPNTIRDSKTMSSFLLNKFPEIISFCTNNLLVAGAVQSDSVVPVIVKQEDLGRHAQDFIDSIPNKYAQHQFTPPFDIKKLKCFYTDFANINKDLIGDMTGNKAQQQMAKDWLIFLHTIQKDNELTDENLRIIAHGILAIYRFNTFRFCHFPHESARIRQLLQLLSTYYDTCNYEQAHFALKQILSTSKD